MRCPPAFRDELREEAEREQEAFLQLGPRGRAKLRRRNKRSTQRRRRNAAWYRRQVRYDQNAQAIA